MKKNRWSSGAPVHVLHCFSTAAAAAAVGGAASFCTYTNFLFHFPFDEIFLSASSPLSAFLLLLLLLLSEAAVVEEGRAVGCVDLVQGGAVSAVSVCLAS